MFLSPTLQESFILKIAELYRIYDDVLLLHVFVTVLAFCKHK